MIIKKEFNNSEEVVVSKKELRVFVLNCLENVGCDPSHAQQLADILICSDYRGHYSHGLNRLHIYVQDLASSSTASSGDPFIIKEKGSTAWVDGNNLLGPVVGNYCMRLAVQKAKEHGIGFVVAKNSNHFGIGIILFGIILLRESQERWGRDEEPRTIGLVMVARQHIKRILYTPSTK